MNESNDKDLEQRLSGLKLARPSDDYIEKSLEAIRGRQAMQTPPTVYTLPFWRRHLPLALAAALVVSISANVFQLVHNRQQLDIPESGQLVQCNTPEVAASPATSKPPKSIFAVPTQELQPQGMC